MLDKSSLGRILAEDVPRKMVDTIADLNEVRQNMRLLKKRRNVIHPKLYKNLEDEYRGKLSSLERKLLRHGEDFERIMNEQKKLLQLLGKAAGMTRDMIADLKLNISLGNYRGQEYGSTLLHLESQLRNYESGILDSKSVVSALDGVLTPNSLSAAIS